ncbi:RNA polymerase sigma factor (sigma-70 family) [Breznakibacter xylanolyticus]|uniref:RNA polymerase sigma factor (Sigma-70 family) n=1 Tax=Breznakibacter xylanolyticus TaxID=990 RepID=A0A2W7N3C5_9BACT|nr:sigma-70 family RNA polymerase sigma factor [Breznakibacter xylanolyticus]PZX14955.1 RNA polymerase sigma factor (sigma-70 family) [Breznakibacter xylanolyticus]
MEDLKIIEFIRQGSHSKALNCLYKNYPAFKTKFIKTGGAKIDAEDIFQQALLILIEKLLDEKFTLKCSLNTFLFSICKNLTNEHFRNKGKTIPFVADHESAEFDVNIDTFIEREKKHNTLNSVLNQMGERCMKILSMYYAQGLSMAEMAKYIGLKSETSAKTQKYKCLMKARELVSEIIDHPVNIEQ